MTGVQTCALPISPPLWIKPCFCISFCYSSPSESGWNGSSSRYDCRRSVVYLLLLLLLSSSHIRGDTGYDAGTYIDIVHLHVKSKFNLHLDIVIWDSHPLALGATLRQVYIDGIPQLENPQELTKLSKFQTLPKTPNWDKEAEETVKWDGVPPLTGKHGGTEGITIQIIGVKSVWHYGSGEHIEPLFDDKKGKGRSVLLQDGLLVCVDDVDLVCGGGDVDEFVDLEGGSLASELTSYGSSLGLEGNSF